MKENNTIVIGTSQRSSTESLKNYAANMVNAAFTMGGAVVVHGEGYPDGNQTLIRQFWK